MVYNDSLHSTFIWCIMIAFSNTKIHILFPFVRLQCVCNVTIQVEVNKLMWYEYHGAQSDVGNWEV